METPNLESPAIDDLKEITHKESWNEISEKQDILVDNVGLKNDRISDSEDYDEPNIVNSNSNSQFYESSDSKVDYAVKLDDSDTLSDIDDIKTDTASADSEDSALGSLPPDGTINDRDEEAQDRSDGSDSGLGLETIEDPKLPIFHTQDPDSDQNQSSENKEKKVNHESSSQHSTNASFDQNPIESTTIKRPMRSNLKRKCSDDNENPLLTKKRKENIKFDSVTVYYFPRSQGFSCVPSQGGSTLGMEWEHTHEQKFTLAEHASEQRRLHRQILQQLKSERHTMQGVIVSSSEDSDTEEEASDISESELDLDNYYFLQPVPTRQRRALLRAAGVRKIEGYEKDECRNIRTSREFCGCACKGICNPENCSCSIAGIKCQVDRLNFPCGCSRDGCGNTTGRIEFNPIRVRTHYIHTLMRLGMEKKNEHNQEVSHKQWSETKHSSSCISSTSYDRERCVNHEDGLLHEVNLTPQVEVESCVNSGNYNNVHCDNATEQTTSIQDNYNFGNDHRHLNENVTQITPTTNCNTTDTYTINMLQEKGQPYLATNSTAFQGVTNNVQRFPQCDLNYGYSQHTDGQFKGVQSYSASSFEEFAHSSQMSMFSHYGHMYVPEYNNKPSTNMHEQYNAVPQNVYEMYKNPSECVNIENNKADPHFTNTIPLPYQSSNNSKMQDLENDENWFSHSTLLNLDHTDPTTQDGSDSRSSERPTESNSSDAPENFGELIKKTMVDSVSV